MLSLFRQLVIIWLAFQIPNLCIMIFTYRQSINKLDRLPDPNAPLLRKIAQCFSFILINSIPRLTALDSVIEKTHKHKLFYRVTLTAVLMTMIFMLSGLIGLGSLVQVRLSPSSPAYHLISGIEQITQQALKGNQTMRKVKQPRPFTQVTFPRPVGHPFPSSVDSKQAQMPRSIGKIRKPLEPKISH